MRPHPDDIFLLRRVLPFPRVKGKIWPFDEGTEQRHFRGLARRLNQLSEFIFGFASVEILNEAQRLAGPRSVRIPSADPFAPLFPNVSCRVPHQLPFQALLRPRSGDAGMIAVSLSSI